MAHRACPVETLAVEPVGRVEDHRQVETGKTHQGNRSQGKKARHQRELPAGYQELDGERINDDVAQEHDEQAFSDRHQQITHRLVRRGPLVNGLLIRIGVRVDRLTGQGMEHLLAES